METESTLLVAWGLEDGGGCLGLWGAFLGDDENVLKLTVVMVAQFCEYTKNH